MIWFCLEESGAANAACSAGIIGSAELIDKLLSLTTTVNAEKIKRSLHLSGRAKSDNEKGYYIVDAINEALDLKYKISFQYYDYNRRKEQVLKNDGNPYTVSPFDLIWDGDFYYLTGYCDDRDEVRVFRVDRITAQPQLLQEGIVPKPADYDVEKYTSEVFRMFADQEAKAVTLVCAENAMKIIIDKFGKDVETRVYGNNKFMVTVNACTGPTFYRWIFGAGGNIRISAPEDVRAEYRKMLQEALEQM